MKKKAVLMSDLHYEHKVWKRQIEFQIDELEIFTHRLEEVVTRWTDKEVLAKAEHFQNTFIRHKEVLDTQLHEINVHNDTLVEFVKEHPIASDHVHFKVETQIEMFHEMKKEFMRFLTETM